MSNSSFLSSEIQNLVSEYESDVSCKTKAVLEEISHRSATRKVTIDETQFRRRVNRILETTSDISTSSRRKMFMADIPVVRGHKISPIKDTVSSPSKTIINNNQMDRILEFSPKQLDKIRSDAMKAEIERARLLVSNREKQYQVNVDTATYEKQFKIALLKADHCLKLKNLKVLRSALVQWKSGVEMFTFNLKSFALKLEWKAQTKCWNIWRSFYKESLARREYVILSYRLKQERLQIDKAVMFHMRRICFKVFSKWSFVISRRKQETECKHIEYRRKKKINDLLQELERDLELMGSTPKDCKEEVPRKVRPKTDEKFIKSMEQRERDRLERKFKAEERRKKREEEMKVLKEQQEIRKKEKEMEEKRQIEVAKLKLVEQIRFEEEQKRLEKERLKVNIKSAKIRYENSMFRQSFSKWKKSIDLHARKTYKAVSKHVSDCLKSSFRAWIQNIQCLEEKRRNMADNFYEATILRYQFGTMKMLSLKKCLHTRKLQDMSSKMIMKRSWRHLTDVFGIIQLKQRKIYDEADIVYRKHLMNSYYGKWLSNLKVEKEKKWREFRRETLRQRAKELLVHSKLEDKLDDIRNK